MELPQWLSGKESACSTGTAGDVCLIPGLVRLLEGWHGNPLQYSCSVWPFCDSMDCSQPGSSVHGISQLRILEWIVISFSRGSSQQGSNPHLLNWQVNSLPLSHLGSPGNYPVSEFPWISQNYIELCYLLNTIFIWAFILLLPKMWVLPTGAFHEGISWFRQGSIKYTCASLTLTSRDKSVCTSLPLCMKHSLELLYQLCLQGKSQSIHPYLNPYIISLYTFQPFGFQFKILDAHTR